MRNVLMKGMPTSASFEKCSYMYNGLSDFYGFVVSGFAQHPITQLVLNEEAYNNIFLLKDDI